MTGTITANVDSVAGDVAFAGVVRQAQLIRQAKVSSRELVELYLERIGRLDPELNAFRTVMADRALAAADEVDARRRDGDERPLLGVPIAVKDSEDVAGEVTGWGSAGHGGPAARDNDFVSRLRAAGAVILGKTNLPELALLGVTEGPAFGVSRNPWNADRTPGGSSGGSGAAVAAGLCAAATASDGGGSIRIPASCCGLVGVKPQRDRISLAPRAEHWYGLSAAGFVTRRVADTALLVDVAAARPPEEPLAEEARIAPGKLRIALSFRPTFPTRVDRQVRSSVEAVAERLCALGHEVVDRDPRYGRALDTWTVRFLAGVDQDAARLPRPERLQRRTRAFARMGKRVPAIALRRARRDEARHAARLGEIFRHHDVLLTPTCARLPLGAHPLPLRGVQR